MLGGTFKRTLTNRYSKTSMLNPNKSLNKKKEYKRPFSNDYSEDWSELSDKVKRRDNFTCKKCGKYYGPKNRRLLHVHHKIPLSRGGKNVLSNLITICWKCHEDEHKRKIGHV